jgi:16S rRNA U1498 N3-methylase RsmE
VSSGPADVRAAAHAFVTDLDVPTLTDADRHHLERVLRVAPNAVVTVSDGAGRWRTVRFGPDLEPLDAIERVPRPAPRLTVGFALVKGDRPEIVV